MTRKAKLEQMIEQQEDTIITSLIAIEYQQSIVDNESKSEQDKTTAETQVRALELQIIGANEKLDFIKDLYAKELAK